MHLQTKRNQTAGFLTASQSSRRSDDDALEEQIKQTSEDSRALRELMEGERGKLRQSLEELQQLHSQVSTGPCMASLADSHPLSVREVT